MSGPGLYREGALGPGSRRKRVARALVDAGSKWQEVNLRKMPKLFLPFDHLAATGPVLNDITHFCAHFVAFWTASRTDFYQCHSFELLVVSSDVPYVLSNSCSLSLSLVMHISCARSESQTHSRSSRTCLLGLLVSI